MSEGRASAAATAALVASGVAVGGALAVVSFLASRSLEDVPRARRVRMSRRAAHDDDSSGDERVRAVPTSRGSKQRLARRDEQDPQACSEDEALALQTGFSMVEARLNADARQKKAMSRSPAEVLADLQRGNARFWTGQAVRPERSAFERRALISKQFPSVAILGCSDSRVPVEIVFDQGLGDLFVIRVAGNCLDTSTQASLQYAVQHLKVKVLIVMGHEACGAVKAAQLPSDAIDQEPEALGRFLKTMKQGLSGGALSRVQDVKAQDREAVTTNVRSQVDALVKDDCIMSKVRDGELMMLGAFYEISSGIVDFFHEVSGQEDEQQPVQRAPSRGVLSRWRSSETASA